MRFLLFAGNVKGIIRCNECSQRRYEPKNRHWCEICALTGEDIPKPEWSESESGYFSLLPDWCPLPSEIPGSGKAYLETIDRFEENR